MVAIFDRDRKLQLIKMGIVCQLMIAGRIAAPIRFGVAH
jgi:hypothetical protein